MSDFLKRTWAQIDLDAIEDNYRAIAASLSEGSRVMAIVKADAYGHGASYVARRLEQAGASWFGVSNLEEAMQLRRAGIRCPILILAYTPPSEAGQLAAHDIAQTVINREYADQLEEQAANAGMRVRVHLKLDTGMTRIGLPCFNESQEAETLRQVEEICRLPHLISEGIFTHFASADEEEGEAFTRGQFERFRRMVEALERRGVRFSLRHCCNSAATLRYPEMHLDLVRPGLILYGLYPSAFIEKSEVRLRPAMELKTVISMVKTVAKGTPVGYGRTYYAAGDQRIATVPIGYADGYPRQMSNRARMLVKGTEVPVVGRVCMDQCMLDVTGVPAAKEGMTVTVFGRDGGAFLPVEAFSALAGTVQYETVCLIGKRVPRIYLSGGQQVGKLSYILP